MNIVLIGYRGTGKTSVAEALSRRLGCEWEDSDRLVEQATGKLIAEIFADQGEAAFRQYESEQLERICRRKHLVLAVGGGAVLRQSNRQLLRAFGRIVWLTASPVTLEKRIRGDERSAESRPNLTNSGGLNEIQQVLAQRTPIYRACADWEVDTEEKTPGEVADEIAARLAEPPPSGDESADSPG